MSCCFYVKGAKPWSSQNIAVHLILFNQIFLRPSLTNDLKIASTAYSQLRVMAGGNMQLGLNVSTIYQTFMWG